MLHPRRNLCHIVDVDPSLGKAGCFPNRARLPEVEPRNTKNGGRRAWHSFASMQPCEVVAAAMDLCRNYDAGTLTTAPRMPPRLHGHCEGNVQLFIQLRAGVVQI